MREFPKSRLFDRATPPHILTLVCLTGLSALAMNVFLPSLDGMAAYFNAEYAFIQLSVALYLAINGFLQLFIGPISDKYGRRVVILWGLGLFNLATLGCILAPNAEIFMIFRMLQAVIAVAMVLARAIVRDIYPQDQAASMLGYVTMGMSLVPMIAPAIGGVLEVRYGWHASFWMLLALGLALFVICWRDLAETAPPSNNSLRQQFAEYPELLRSPRFWGYCMASALSSGAFFAYLGGAPFVGVKVYQLSPDELGLYFAAPGAGYFLGNFITARYSVRVGLTAMIFWGNALCAVALLPALILSFAGAGSAAAFFGSVMILGIGNGMVIPNAQAGMLSVRPHLAGTASGLGSAIMIGGGAALSALAGTLLKPGSTDLPLVSLMMICCLAALGVILLVTRRENRLRL
ncbi:multidrug effflux MFS transporter [uncultured Lentibacter sp.]|jgi:DHA1 family bicyclomycin/chloramphenicol resistance-like MFS transporter|uniref:multidrug effflux MFS transporter n=1 Tax=uncultured Lentibacter sp. TaxID=1659309 RepID=UPI0026376C87|nr:multidrug effflux MFS transporter [uncultured Lentibacter sp.]